MNDFQIGHPLISAYPGKLWNVSKDVNPNLLTSEGALQRGSYKKVFWKYGTNLQESPIQNCDFNKVAKQL